MHIRKLSVLALSLSLLGCATPMPLATECAPPPPPPENVRQWAAQDRPSYSERARNLFDLFRTLIETAPD